MEAIVNVLKALWGQLGTPLLWMVIAVIAGSFSAILDPELAQWFKAVAGSATGVAGLLLHPQDLVAQTPAPRLNGPDAKV